MSPVCCSVARECLHRNANDGVARNTGSSFEFDTYSTAVRIHPSQQAASRQPGAAQSHGCCRGLKTQDLLFKCVLSYGTRPSNPRKRRPLSLSISTDEFQRYEPSSDILFHLAMTSPIPIVVSRCGSLSSPLPSSESSSNKSL